MNKEENLFKSRFEKHKDIVFRLCLGYFNQNRPLAEDALQDTFVKAWVYRKQFREESSWQTWIYRIAINTCLLKIKKEKKELQKNQEFNQEAPWETEVDLEENIQKMHRCIQSLKPDNRILILMVLEGIPYSTIASTLGLSAENLRVKIHRIKKQLQPCIQHGRL